jgi:hypothetical protein
MRKYEPQYSLTELKNIYINTGFKSMLAAYFLIIVENIDRFFSEDIHNFLENIKEKLFENL